MSTYTNSTDNKDSTMGFSGSQKKILIVDDDLDLTSMFKMVIEMNGFEVGAYNDPLLALRDFKANTFGMALLDLRMPQMNGFQLYNKLQEIDNKMKVCFITAFEDYNEEFKQSFPELDEKKCFVRKPKAIEDLVKHVAAILG
jgi:DNA-binding NtrC family response regulator